MNRGEGFNTYRGLFVKPLLSVTHATTAVRVTQGYNYTIKECNMHDTKHIRNTLVLTAAYVALLCTLSAYIMS